PIDAIAVLTPSNGSDVRAVVLFHQDSIDSPLMIYANITGLPAATVHAWHIHALGDISDPNGAKLGLHFDPFNTGRHGCVRLNRTRHAGDLSNLPPVSASGVISQFVTVLDSPNILSLYRGTPGYFIGRGLIIHQNVDDCVSQPVGNAGGRWAQGVVGYR
ncbi:superoxide dismutase, partial [Cladochytrium replicatum]